MKTMCFVFVCMLICSSVGVHAKTLERASNKEMIHLLNDFVIVEEVNNPPLAVRIVRLSDHGECDGKPESCPKELLYIAVSTFDENPNETLYVLPKSYGWTFVRWTNMPVEDEEDMYAAFEVTKKEISPNRNAEWWSEKTYEIRVNHITGNIREKRK